MMKIKFIAFFLFLGMLVSCGSESSSTNNAVTGDAKAETVVEEVVKETSINDKGFIPITSVTLGEIDPELVEKGKDIYKKNCTACHKMGKRFIGPALAGITERRTPEWIMNIIINPEEMVKTDPIAKALLAEYIAPMANQNITEEEARAMLEFFRTKN